MTDMPQKEFPSFSFVFLSFDKDLQRLVDVHVSLDIFPSQTLLICYFIRKPSFL